MSAKPRLSIDSHQHFWQVARGDYGWMGEHVAPLLRDFLPDDLRPHLARAGIDRTILVQAAETFLPLALKREVDLVIGGVFNSGILASASGRKKFNYVDAPPEVLAKVERLEAACRSFDVPLPAAAIQYPLRHPASTVVVIGAKTAAQVQGNVEWFERDIPAELWTTLEAEGLIPAL